MTNQEIDHRLAMAIGYPPDRIRIGPMCRVQVLNDNSRIDGPMPIGLGWQRFDHTDWAVMGPIAEKFDAFPRRSSSLDPDWWTVLKDGAYTDKNHPATAAALAVIKFVESKK